MDRKVNDVIKLSLIGFIALLILNSCSSKSAFIHNPAGIKAKKSINKTAGIVYLEDSRGKKIENLFFISFIPLVPFGPIYYDRPEAGTYFCGINSYMFRASEDITKALYTDLKNSNLFKNVHLYFNEDKIDDDIIIKGIVHETTYEGAFPTYGLGPFAGFLYMLGAPGCWDTFKVDIELTVYDRKYNRILLHNRYKKNVKYYHGLYYNISFKDGFPDLIKDINIMFIKDLEEQIKE